MNAVDAAIADLEKAHAVVAERVAALHDCRIRNPSPQSSPQNNFKWNVVPNRILVAIQQNLSELKSTFDSYKMET